MIKQLLKFGADEILQLWKHEIIESCIHIIYTILKAPWYTDNSRATNDPSYNNIYIKKVLIWYNEGKKYMGK